MDFQERKVEGKEMILWWMLGFQLHCISMQSRAENLEAAAFSLLLFKNSKVWSGLLWWFINRKKKTQTTKQTKLLSFSSASISFLFSFQKVQNLSVWFQFVLFQLKYFSTFFTYFVIYTIQILYQLFIKELELVRNS